MSAEPEKQEAPPHAGEQVTFRGMASVAAARRVLGLLITLREATLVFDKETKAVLIGEVGGDAAEQWSAGDKVIDYAEYTAVCELLDRAEDEWNRE